jgi:coenzyme F420-reducing hydrogenase delta subunit
MKTSKPEGEGQEQPGGQQPQSGEGQQYGEGNYKAARQYNEGLKEHVQNHDIEKEARDAAPRSAEEAREMEEAENIGKSRARVEQTPDAPI